MTDEPMARVLPRNIEALLQRRRDEHARRTIGERISDAVTGFAGSMKFVLLHVVLFGSWIIANLPGVPFPRFDPSFVLLAVTASVETIFLSTFVLISQNRMAAAADKRADLGLHVSLLAEHEITKLVDLVSAIAEHHGLHQARNPELGELKKHIAPEKVLDIIEKKETQEQPPAA